MNSSNRTYLASFIVDNRGREETVDQLVDGTVEVFYAAVYEEGRPLVGQATRGVEQEFCRRGGIEG